MPKIKRLYKALIVSTAVLLSGLLLPGSLSIPVKNASSDDWNKDTFWYEPWGISGVHKGIDIFAETSTPIISPTPGIVLYTGEIPMGGNVVVMLAGKWRIHYFAHLAEINTSTGSYLSQDELLGTVGDTGNAKGKQPHLHYSIVSLIPYIWKIDNETQGWKKMFFLNPVDYFE